MRTQTPRAPLSVWIADFFSKCGLFSKAPPIRKSLRSSLTSINFIILRMMNNSEGQLNWCNSLGCAYPMFTSSSLFKAIGWCKDEIVLDDHRIR